MGTKSRGYAIMMEGDDQGPKTWLLVQKVGKTIVLIIRVFGSHQVVDLQQVVGAACG